MKEVQPLSDYPRQDLWLPEPTFRSAPRLYVGAVCGYFKHITSLFSCQSLPAYFKYFALARLCSSSVLLKMVWPSGAER